MRVCNTCLLPKDDAYFDLLNSGNRRSTCKVCRKKRARELYKDHPDTSLKNAEKQREKLRASGRIRDTERKWRISHYSKKGINYKTHEEHLYLAKQRKIENDQVWVYGYVMKQMALLRLCDGCGCITYKYEYCSACTKKLKVKKTIEHQNEMYHSNAKFRINKRLRNAIGKHLRGEKSGRHWFELVGWTLNDLIKHIGRQLTPPMTWDNYGIVWHIDHKIPIAAFNFERAEDIDFKKAWSLKNLQPLLALENIKKSDKLERPHQPSLCISI